MPGRSSFGGCDTISGGASDFPSWSDPRYAGRRLAGPVTEVHLPCRPRSAMALFDPDRPFAHALSCKGKNHGFGPRGKYSHPIMPAALMIGHQSRFGPSAIQRTLGRLLLAGEDSLVDFLEALTHGRVGGAAQSRNRATARCNGSLPLREPFTACATKE